MLKIDSKIAILIPTRNRSGFLNRALKYYAKMKFKCFFIIGDSSTKISEKDRTEEVCNFYSKNLNIKYVHYSGDIGFGKKLSEMCNLSTYTYTAIIGDDDFIVHKGLLECSKFLDNNDDTVGVYGERLGLMMVDDPNKSSNWYASRQFRFKNIIGENFIERIHILETPSWSQHIYSLYRTDVIKTSLDTIKNLDYSSSNEYLLYMSIAIAGNWVKLDNLYAICGFETKVFQYRDRKSFPHYSEADTHRDCCTLCLNQNYMKVVLSHWSGSSLPPSRPRERARNISESRSHGNSLEQSDGNTPLLEDITVI